ncbi:hypothetical protein OC846_003981 [Tilletia horrida]|uniref:Acyl-CoA thioesterase II n=1 Tax=Tilletia horrida TaxID=155126 RepID=A0AAN6GRG4_9BASI|nr:hypothetical protein OC846_003981 [Tilletia horrida]KAK0562486.1 hypothetical protein OC861_005283 [Tilletia horrida]
MGDPPVRHLPKDVPVFELLRIKKLENGDPDGGQAPKQPSLWRFTTVLTGFNLVPGPNIFGGISFALAVQAAYETIHEEVGAEAAANYAVYSLQGSFCAPAPAQHAVHISIETIRRSRSFITRLVTLSQHSVSSDGGPRKFMVAVCDFVLKGRPSLVEFDTPPLNPVTQGQWKKATELPSPIKVLEQRMKEAETKGDETLLAALKSEHDFRNWWNGFCIHVPPPDSLLKDTYMERVRDLPTAQDELSIPDRRLADWFRILPDLSEASLAKISAQRPDCVPFRSTSFHRVCLAAMLDQVIPIAAVSVAKVPEQESAATVTLDFAVRFHRDDDLDANRWFLREVRSHTASSGRSLNMSTVWDEMGRIVATNSEQCLYSPRPAPKKAARL